MGEAFEVIFGSGRPPRACHIEVDKGFLTGLHPDDSFQAAVDLGFDSSDGEDRLKLLENGLIPVTPKGERNTLVAWATYVKPPKTARVDFEKRVYLATFIVTKLGKRDA
jgi:hypothetical protein